MAMIGLGIESSCDDTSVSIIADGFRVLSLQIHSQIALHSPFGGVVPELASRNHLIKINYLLDLAMKEASISWPDIHYIAVTNRPGLIGSLLIGVQCAKTIHFLTGVPLFGVNHLAGHIHAPFLEYSGKSMPRFPESPAVLALLISGGNSALIEYSATGKLHLISTTRDDAAGEAFDKTAKLLHLGYPGGPLIEKIARESSFNQDRDLSELPIPPILRGTEKSDLSFSFSGIKTAVFRLIQTSVHFTAYSEQVKKKFPNPNSPLYQEPFFTCNGLFYSIADLAFALQFRIAEILVRNVERYLSSHFFRQNRTRFAPTLILTGGVAANGFIRQKFSAMVEKYNFSLSVPPPLLCTDNAAMIGAAGYFLFQKQKEHNVSLEASSRIDWASFPTSI